MNRKIILSVFLVFVINITNAQKLTQFTSDSVKFIKELHDYFYDFSANKDDAEKYVQNFGKVWKAPEFVANYCLP